MAGAGREVQAHACRCCMYFECLSEGEGFTVGSVLQTHGHREDLLN